MKALSICHLPQEILAPQMAGRTSTSATSASELEPGRGSSEAGACRPGVGGAGGRGSGLWGHWPILGDVVSHHFRAEGGSGPLTSLVGAGSAGATRPTCSSPPSCDPCPRLHPNLLSPPARLVCGHRCQATCQDSVGARGGPPGGHGCVCVWGGGCCSRWIFPHWLGVWVPSAPPPWGPALLGPWSLTPPGSQLC